MYKILVFVLLGSIYISTIAQTYNQRMIFDSNNQLVKVIMADDRYVSFTYDELGNRTMISQSVNTQSPILKVTPLNIQVSAISGVSVIAITNIGYGNMAWSATTNTPWISIVGSKSGMNSGSLTINYQANTGIKRIGTIIVTAPSADNSPQTITIEQAALEFSNHVWHIATTGSDLTGNGTLDKPFFTIQKGIELASIADTVLVHQGTFKKNVDFVGKNIFVTSEYYYSQDTSVINSTIIQGTGGRVVRIANHESEKAELNGFTIIGGTAITESEPSGGGIFVWSSTPRLLNLKVKNNLAMYGGGIDINTASPYLYNVTVFNNEAKLSGGGINCNLASPKILNSVISGNSAPDGAGLVFYDRSNALVSNCLVYRNVAANGAGGISVNQSNPRIVNSTIVNNIAGNGSGINSYLSSPIITNSIIWQNSLIGTANISYSDIQSGYSGIGNIDINPEFNDPISNNFSLKGVSPCLNVGKPDTTGLGIAVKDIIGNPRVFGSVIDMGAYEHQSNPIPGEAGTITGNATVCQGALNETYSVPPIANATSYIWTLPTGAIWTSVTNSIILNFSNSAMSGVLKVKGRNNNIDGSESSLLININSVPTTMGEIGGNITICKEATEIYSVQPNISASSYIWTLPEGSLGKSSSYSIPLTFGANSISGIIKVKGHNQCGDGTESSLAITVNTIPVAAGSIIGNTTVCKGSEATYTVPEISGATSFIWSLPAGATGNSTTNSIKVYYGNNSISGNITVKGHNECGDGTESSMAVTINTVPVTAGLISGITTICQGPTLINYTVPEIAGSTSYVWTLPPNAEGGSTSYSIAVIYGVSSSSGNATVRGHNECGNGVESSLPIIVSPVPAIPVISNLRPLTFFELDSTVLVSSETSGNQWYKDGNIMGGVTSKNITIKTSGSYTVAASNLYCTSNKATEVNVTVKPDNNPPVSSVLALPEFLFVDSVLVKWSGTDAETGIKDYTIFVSTDGTTFTSWLGNTTKTEAYFKGTLGNTYSFYCKARDKKGNLESKTVKEAQTWLALNVSIAKKWDDVLVCNNSAKLFTSYQWYKNDQPIAGATKQFYQELGGLNGSYYLIATTADGKRGRSNVSRLVATAKSINVFPNPTENRQEFNITINALETDMEHARLSITSLTGQVIVQRNVVQQQMKLSNLPTGTYIVQVVFSNEESLTKKLEVKY